MIILETNIFNVFPCSVFSVLKILTSNYHRETLSYIPARHLWLKSLYFDFLNRSEKNCLTIDCQNVNSVGPGKMQRRSSVILSKRKKINHLIFL